MQHKVFDVKASKKTINSAVKRLEDYRAEVKQIVAEKNFDRHEAALATPNDELMDSLLNDVVSQIGEVQHVVLIGIGGSSLGTEAVHAALGGEKQLHVLDAVAPHKLAEVLHALEGVSLEDLAICSISKSGSTTETLTNTSVLLEHLQQKLGDGVYTRTVVIGDPENALIEKMRTLGAHTAAMQPIIGGRYSVFTLVGLIPLRLLGYDTRRLLNGLAATLEDQHEEQVAEGAARLYDYLVRDYRSVNFFAFDTRLERLGYWYRQLTAESLGKAKDADGKKVEMGFIPTTSTPVELHSIGQLYFSGFAGVYTDFVALKKTDEQFTITQHDVVASHLTGKNVAEIHNAIYGGVVGAYEARKLPFRLTELEGDIGFELGLFMGMRMLETMYVAKLMNVDAFDQPNVELYKDKTRKILNI